MQLKGMTSAKGRGDDKVAKVQYMQTRRVRIGQGGGYIIDPQKGNLELKILIWHCRGSPTKARIEECGTGIEERNGRLTHKREDGRCGMWGSRNVQGI
jgi:hypothetical protein